MTSAAAAEPSGPIEPDFPRPRPHSLAEDAYGLLSGALLMALGLVIMKASGIVTAGMGGVALLFSYLFGMTVDFWFWTLNVPFLILAWSAMGRGFFFKTVCAVAAVSLMAAVTRVSLDIQSVHPAFAAVAGGTAAGAGVMGMLRHRSGVGGVTIVSVWLNRRKGWSVGWLTFALDGIIILAAITTRPPELAAWSVLSVVAMSAVLILFHRPGRYTGY
ncbi:YitT family protein [Croceicoccus marinus]|uniref:YitT family protein n=1 Tax=Croceicoccus marinus TaxID=450378 RepID=A0A1Z1FAS5_9SPHN|nr:YitT family protein [Croceicoccus marinus]ARU15865.1 hypothetical protein A9D14_06275 [Croceicoccus marinus]